jgi:hypothetical protein
MYNITHSKHPLPTCAMETLVERGAQAIAPYMWMCGEVDMCGYVCICVYMCGCVDMWMCGYVDMWMCGCVEKWICGSGWEVKAEVVCW